MQDRYAGDIGDYVKLSLLRYLGRGQRLGVAWYLHPDEGHNSDGKHVSYLHEPGKWRDLDPTLFDTLEQIVRNNNRRSVEALQRAEILEATFAKEPIKTEQLEAQKRSEWRSDWFARVLDRLSGCDLIFADPDNGLVDDKPDRRKQKKFGKQLPLCEVMELAESRSAIVYHHNTRRKGGHDAEVEHWLDLLGPNSLAVRANAYSPRTFFIVNPSPLIKQRAGEFCERWSRHKVWLHSRT